MHRLITVFACFALLTASSALAISPSDDLLIAAAARTSRWTADMYITNTGGTDVTVSVMWLERGQANPTPVTRTFELDAGQTLVLNDVIANNFGMNSATGAFRITAPGGEVTANLIVYTGAGSPDGTYGSGFEAIPASSATSDGVTTLSGATLNDSFYTNVFATAGANGVTMNLDLLDPDGDSLGTTVQLELDPYEPWLSAVSDLWNVGNFDDGTVRASVTEGSMVMLGSKVDRLSKDPTTLEQAFGAGGGSVDGIYQFSIWDGSFAAGGEMIINNGVVEAIYGTYMNEQKVDGQGEPECGYVMLWGHDFSSAPVEDFASGFEFTDDMYHEQYWPEGGDIHWTVTFSIDDNIGFTGTIGAEGSDFIGADTGCNGVFPQLVLYGGKSN
jgi:hypothetical protein